MTSIPDYYSILNLESNASYKEIRQAYKREALLSHPDRLPEDTSQEDRQEATRKFQLIADAYQVLGNAEKRQNYDSLYSMHNFTRKTTPKTSVSGAHVMFGGAFEELLKAEVEHPTYLWRMLGAGAGLVIGFILANVGGAAIGAFAGKTIGQIRDRKGVSVYTAFERLAAPEKKKILTALLTQFLTHGASGMMK
ncbi:DnaJ-domain-containing protein [Spinellus fusiger]|nr:DnaJ-domain-containing protein [Spinellus fusiger]